MAVLDKKIRELNREILALKTSHPMASGMKTFWGEFTLELEAYVHDEYDPAQFHTYYFEIEFVEGQQPILTNVFANYNTTTWIGMMVLESPYNNKQILAVWDTGYGNIIEIALSSSRQILGLRRVSDPN